MHVVYGSGWSSMLGWYLGRLHSAGQAAESGGALFSVLVRGRLAAMWCQTPQWRRGPSRSIARMHVAKPCEDELQIPRHFFGVMDLVRGPGPHAAAPAQANP